MKFYLSADMKRTLDTLIKDNIKTEFTLWGKSEVDKEKDRVEIIDLRVQWQESTGATTDTDEEKDLELYMKLQEQGEDMSKWNVHIHSHNTMGASFSCGDDDNMKSYAKRGINHHYFIVMSDKEYKGAYYSYKPFMLYKQGIEVEIGTESKDKKVIAIQKKIDKLWVDYSKLSSDINIPNEYTDHLLQELELKNNVRVPETKTAGNRTGFQSINQSGYNSQTVIEGTDEDDEDDDVIDYNQTYLRYYEIVDTLTYSKSISMARRRELRTELEGLGESLGYEDELIQADSNLVLA